MICILLSHLLFKHIILTARPELVEGYEQQTLIATSATNG
jgi:hypothetical protein